MNVLFLKSNNEIKEKIKNNILLPTTQNLKLLHELGIIKNLNEFKKYLILNNIKKIILI
jgi:hypothetical protein